MNAPATGPHKTAAFVRIEETLLGSHELLASLYMALNAPGPGRRLGRLGAFAASLPALGLLKLGDRLRMRRLAALQLRGLGRDRIEVLSSELYPRFLSGKLRREGLELIERLRADGHAVVLRTGFLADALRPILDEVPAEALVGNRLEYRDGKATGKLLETWSDRPGWLRDYARREHINLRGSYGYGADAADRELLQEVGFPCVVNPDLRMRREATREGWPILEVSA